LNPTHNRELYFATSNPHKFGEAKPILAASGIIILHLPFVHDEIRSDSLEEIALEAVSVAFSKLKKPVFVEDTGLFINALNGFPGTYSAWVQKKIGNEGILRLLRAIPPKERSAVFRTAIAYADNDGKTKTFIGECAGSISLKIRGKGGFGYDSIFIPDGHTVTFAENVSLKNNLSHRYKSLRLFADYYLSM